jgi:hypothetical protein
MNMKWMKPNEGRLHKGNPLKSVTKAVKKAVSQTGKTVSKAGKQIEQGVVSVASAAQDPQTWIAYATGGTGAGIAMTAKEAKVTYEAMSQAEKDEANAEAERRTAMTEEARLAEDQKQTQAKQAKMVKEREAKATARSEDRARRLGTGRRGLLYQGSKGKETGTSNVLGG